MEELEVCPCKVIAAETSPSCSSKKTEKLTAAISISHQQCELCGTKPHSKVTDRKASSKLNFSQILPYSVFWEREQTVLTITVVKNSHHLGSFPVT